MPCDNIGTVLFCYMTSHVTHPTYGLFMCHKIPIQVEFEILLERRIRKFLISAYEMDNLFEIVQSECSVDSLPSELKESIESKNININDVDDFGLTGRFRNHIFSSKVLHYTSEMGNLEMLKYLISNSADPSILSTEGSSSPLHHAAKEGHIDVMSFLITEQYKI